MDRISKLRREPAIWIWMRLLFTTREGGAVIGTVLMTIVKVWILIWFILTLIEIRDSLAVISAGM